MASPEHPASWTGRFVRVYERPRSGFQFSPIISNGRVSWQVLSGHYSFYHFASLSSFFFCPFSVCISLSLSSSAPSLLFPSRAVFFGLSTAGAFSKLPTWEDLSSAPTSPGSPITSCRYYRRERGVPEEKGVLAEGATMRPGGFHFRDLWGSLRERMHVTFAPISVSR